MGFYIDRPQTNFMDSEFFNPMFSGFLDLNKRQRRRRNAAANNLFRNTDCQCKDCKPVTVSQLPKRKLRRKEDEEDLESDNEDIKNEKSIEESYDVPVSFNSEGEEVESEVSEDEININSDDTPSGSGNQTENTNEEDEIMDKSVEMKLEKLSQIQSKVQKLANEIDSLEDIPAKSKLFLYYEETLMKCLVELDEILAAGVTDIQKTRKSIVKEILDHLKTLESKVVNI